MDNLSEEIVLRYLNRECSEEDFKAINAWMKDSKENERILFELEEAFHSGKQEQFSQQDFLDKKKKALYKRIELENSSRRRFRLIPLLMKYAAMIAIVAACTLGFSHLLKEQILSDDIVVSVSANETVKEVTLPDGTKVWLNQSTVLKYAKSFAKSQRNVFLEGEAYFEVAKDKTKPFIVKTDVFQVKVLGTHFNIQCNKKENVAKATLIEGEVEVKGNNEEGMIVLSPGQKAEFNKITKRLQVKQINAKLDIVWRNNLIPFEKATIFEIANTLERFYDVKIILSPNISTNTYSGSLPLRGSVDSVLNSLKNSIPISYRITGSNIYIQSSK
ncbi:MAG: FecR domain-containing protein [Bacteroides sp.]